MSFACPWAFALFAPWALCAWRMLRRTRGTAVPLPGAARLARRPTWRQRAGALPPLLALAGLAAGIVALARPRNEFSRVVENRDALAIEMAIDVSGSMMAMDFTTDRAHPRTRLDVVKETFREFVARRPDDLVGLVAFGGYATTLCPLTADHEALLAVLAEAQVPGSRGERVDAEETATAIGDGLAMACARLAAATNLASRVAILLSDGVSNYGAVSPEQATALARQQGVKVYTIGVGGNGVVPVLWHDEDGRPRYVTDRVAIDEEALRGIAEATGGRYFNVRTQGALEEALAEIDGLERTSVDVAVFRRYEERYAPWLAACLVLLALALALAGGGRRGLL